MAVLNFNFKQFVKVVSLSRRSAIPEPDSSLLAIGSATDTPSRGTARPFYLKLSFYHTITMLHRWWSSSLQSLLHYLFFHRSQIWKNVVNIHYRLKAKTVFTIHNDLNIFPLWGCSNVQAAQTQGEMSKQDKSCLFPCRPHMCSTSLLGFDTLQKAR